MPLGEGAAGAGLQVPLERDRSPLVGEFHYDVDFPRPAVRRVEAAPRIVCLESSVAVTGDAGVIPLGISETPKNVDAALWDPHTGPVIAGLVPDELSDDFAPGPEKYAGTVTLQETK